MSFFSKLADTIFGPVEQRADQSYRMGMKQLEKNRMIHAEYHFRTAVRLEPQTPSYRMAHANILLLMGDVEKAIAQYEAAADHKDLPAIFFSNWGVALRHSGKLEESKKRHEKALELAPDDPESLINAFATLHTLGEIEQSISLLERIIAIEPENVSANYHLANIQGADVGEELFLQRLEIAGTQEELKAEILLTKGTYLLSKGERSEAIDLIKQALKLEPRLSELIEVNEMYAPVKDLDFYQAFVSETLK